MEKKMRFIVEASVSFATDECVKARGRTVSKPEVMDSVKEGIREALDHGMHRGFNHPLSDFTSICIDDVKVAK